MAGVDEWVIDIQDVEKEILVERLAALWKNRATVCSHLHEVMPNILRQARGTGVMVRKDFALLSGEGK